MYPRNAASPPRIAIGAVIQISDGAVQSSGVSVVVRAEGGSETAGGGTVSYGASSSIVYYAPTQAETNYTAFVVAAYKTGCIPVAQTVITSKSDTSGYAGLDWGQVINPTTTVGLTNTTIATTQKVDVETIKTNAVVNAGTITFPTGATLASTTNITAGTVTTATNVTTVNGLAANVITAASIATDAGSEIADAILDRDMATGTDSGSTTVRTVRQALRFLRNKWGVSAGTLTVYKEDDSTSSWTGAVTSDAAADPIIGNDPGGP